MSKKVVLYKPNAQDVIKVGSRGVVDVIGYPGNANIPSGYSGVVHTSQVLAVNGKEFETLNSIYRPIEV